MADLDPPRRRASSRLAYLREKNQEQERGQSRHSRGLRSIKSTLTPPALGPHRPIKWDRRLRMYYVDTRTRTFHGHPSSYTHFYTTGYHQRRVDVAANGIRSSIDAPLQEKKTWKDDDGYICTNDGAAWNVHYRNDHFQKYNTFPCPPGCPDNLYVCTIKQNGRTDRYWKLFDKGYPKPFMDCDSKGNPMRGVDQVVLRSKVAVDKYIERVYLPGG
jgi:hypothetical protein